jgi:hypothetical protein
MVARIQTKNMRDGQRFGSIIIVNLRGKRWIGICDQAQHRRVRSASEQRRNARFGQWTNGEHDRLWHT